MSKNCVSREEIDQALAIVHATGEASEKAAIVTKAVLQGKCPLPYMLDAWDPQVPPAVNE